MPWASPPFWCHSCHSVVSPPPSVSAPPRLCPLCHLDFLEEIGSLFSLPSAPPPPPPPPPQPASSSSVPTSRQRFRHPPAAFLHLPAPQPSSSHGRFRILHRLHSLFSPNHRRRASQTLASLPPSPFDVRDFLLGPGLDLLLQQLAQTGLQRHGSPPASQSAVDSMPAFTVDTDSLLPDDLSCAVCMEIFAIGGQVREMPCKHLYHSDCILPWLALHSSCPVCRHEMPTELPTDSQLGSGEENSLVIRTRAEGVEAGGERGLAIVGIPGVGIHVRSFMLFGIGSIGNQASSGDTVNTELESELRAFMIADSTEATEAAAASTSHNDEADVLSVRRPFHFSVSGRHSGSWSQTRAPERGSSFVSRLLRSSSGSNVADRATNSTNSARRWGHFLWRRRQ